jgi:Transcriptional regulators
MDKKKSISMKGIAELANVSVATVSRVINNNGRFSKETQEKIQAIIAEYGYVTNMAAKSLRMSKSKTIGLIVPNIDNEWFSQLVLEIENFFFKEDYSVFICNTSQDENKEIAYFKSLDSKLVDGIICISGIEQIPVDVITRNIPIVCIDRKPKDHSNAYYVESNHYSGGYLATEELIKQGCKRIVIVSRNKTLSVNKQRLEGYRQALKDYHLKEYKELQLLLDPSKANYEGAREAMNQLIKKGIPFDGIFATNDWRAYGAMVALIENNIKIPEQVKIIGFDDVFISQSCHPSLSTIKQDISGLAKKASDLLLRLMNDIDIEDDHKRYILPVEVIRRDSTKKA